MVRIENWSVVSRDPYYPDRDRRLMGEVHGHPRFNAGEVVTTSRIVASEGRVVTTKSGSTYELGEPAASYVEWVRTNLDKEIDPDNPIKFLEG